MKLIKHKLFWCGIGTLAADIALFCGTNATKVVSWLLITGFVLLAISCYIALYYLLGLGAFYGVKVRHKRQLALYLTAFAACLIALQSVGELARRDVIVLLPLALLAYTYSAYAKPSPRQIED